METTNPLLGSLLYDVQWYIELFGGPAMIEAFSDYYSGIPGIRAEGVGSRGHKDENENAAVREARSLALGRDLTPGVVSHAPKALRSIFSSVKLPEKVAPPSKYLEIQPLHRDAELLDDNAINERNLKNHLAHFMKELKFLKARNSVHKLETVLPLLEKYFWCVAPRGLPDDNDVSLYALAKMSTAILACWPRTENNLPSKPDRTNPSYSLICGDISGIQKYIYRISSAKGAAKGLKARSFELAILSDAVAKHLLIKFSLTSANLIYSSGGKFYILAPASAKSRIDDEKENSLNFDLASRFWTDYGGELFLGIGAVILTGNDFMAENFGGKWQEVSERTNTTKQKKFHLLMASNYQAIFGSQGAGGVEATCDLCQREATPDYPLRTQFAGTPDQYEACPFCEETLKLGSNLAMANLIAEVVNDKTSPSNGISKIKPLGLGVTYYVMNTSTECELNGDAITYLNFNICDYTDENFLMRNLEAGHVNCGFRFYGGNEKPREEETEELLDYNDLAESSQGLKRLGVLRMDVDFLGKIFRDSLKPQNSVARVLTLSWHLNHYFSGRLNELRRRITKRSAFIVYAGGDDLFIVGAWNRLLELAQEIQKDFFQYTQNPQLTISGGVAMVPQKFPIHKAAVMSGEAEDAAKTLSKEKDAFAFLDKPLRWADFDIAASICQELVAAIETTSNGDGEATESLNKGIIDRLRRIYGLYDQNRRKKERWRRDKKMTLQLAHYLEMLRFDKWRWMLTYALRRYGRTNKNHEDFIKRLQKALLEDKWIDQKGKHHPVSSDQVSVIDFIDVPTRWAEFLTRDEPK